jgi:hypothetical protein
MRRERFLRGKRPSAKAWHHQQERIGFQRKAPQNNFRRLIACPVPVGEFCCESISYFPVRESSLPLALLLGLLNSKLLEWFFRLGSTNAVVSEYQINNLPAPVFARDQTGNSELPEFADAVERRQWDRAFDSADAMLQQPPFPLGAMRCVIQLVGSIVHIESARGEIARMDRSALAPVAQPYQDLIDRILYRMAGLTDSEAAGLERRLAEML